MFRRRQYRSPFKKFWRRQNFGYLERPNVPRVKRVMYGVRDNQISTYHAVPKKTEQDLKCHVFYASQYWEIVKANLDFYEHTYLFCRLDKVKFFVEISLQDSRRYWSDPDDKHDTAYVGGPMKYLWHYNYEGTSKDVQCDISYVASKCLKYVRPWNPNRAHKHTITWYFKPDNWINSDNDFSLSWNDFMKGQGSTNVALSIVYIVYCTRHMYPLESFLFFVTLFKN
jgi:hypothetical protein